MSAIREAVAADVAAIAALHLLSWQTAYRGILPDDYIDGALGDDLLAQCTPLLQNGARGSSSSPWRRHT